MINLNSGILEAVNEIKKRKAKIVLVQVPEGLKAQLVDICTMLERETKAAIIGSINPCYGSCDIATEEAKLVNADIIVHFGHNKILDIPNVVYIPLEYEISEQRFRSMVDELEALFKKQGWLRAAIVGTAQGLKLIGQLEKEFKKRGFKVLVGRESGLARGQILGCRTHAAKSMEERANAIIYVGDGAFHPIALILTTELPIVIFDPVNKKVRLVSEQERKLHLKRRWGRIALAMRANTFGIIMSSKLGQFNIPLAMRIKKHIEENGKHAFLFIGNDINERALQGIKLDCFVITACPRLGVDGIAGIKVPAVTVEELLLALNFNNSMGKSKT
jgi:2-(3-amino-3-carboxypropyl)histidine synthase